MYKRVSSDLCSYIVTYALYSYDYSPNKVWMHLQCRKPELLKCPARPVLPVVPSTPNTSQFVPPATPSTSEDIIELPALSTPSTPVKLSTATPRTPQKQDYSIQIVSTSSSLSQNCNRRPIPLYVLLILYCHQ